MHKPAWQHLVIGGTKLSVTHSDTHEKPKFEKCKYTCSKEFLLHSTAGDP